MESMKVVVETYALNLAASLAVAYGLKKILNLVKFKLTKGRRSPEAQPLSEDEIRRMQLEERKPGLFWNTAMFFPDHHAANADSTTQQFLWYFAEAKTSIRICIYNLNFQELENVLTQQYERGLIVQIITGNETIANCLRLNCGLPCGTLPRDADVLVTDQLTHHKFAIIDDEAVLTGSMNWVVEGFFINKENVCVSTNPKLVEGFLMEFNTLLWTCEKANKYF